MTKCCIFVYEKIGHFFKKLQIENGALCLEREVAASHLL
jgi:hypothetical protein